MTAHPYLPEKHRHAIPARVRMLLPLIGSPIDGEALAACNAIVKTLAAAGLDLNDLAAVIHCSSEAKPNTLRATHLAFDLARTCRDLERGILSARERAFVGEMVRRGRRSPSPKQARWLGDIYAKIQDELAA